MSGGQLLLAAALAAASASAWPAAAPSLRDAPIAGSSPALYLDSGGADGVAWTASEPSLGLRVAATVPGDVISDLQRAGVVPDPYFETAFRDNRTLWAPERAWTLAAANVSLPPPGAAPGSSLLLVLESVKSGARVSFNGVALGEATNQFVRYVFELPAAAVRAAPGANAVAVAFDGSLELSGRFMPCSGSWDWAPLSELSINDTAFGPATTFSIGVVKSAYVAAVAPSSVAILHVVPQVRYRGAYPVGALVDGAHAGFNVSVTVHVWAPAGGAVGVFSVAGEWAGAAAASAPTTSPAGESYVTLVLQAPASAVALWWPLGMGAQPLFGLNATWTPSAGPPAAAATAARRIAFRTATLVTVNDTNATIVQESTGADGSGTFGLFVRVNGAAIYARGANLVPMEELEGRLDAVAFQTLVRSAAAAGMNMLRIWGGGTYPPDVFFDTCDELGVLLYFDLQFAGGGHDIASARLPLSAAANASILAEVAHQVRRLSPHPSIFLWDAANEVIVQRSGPSELYASLVMSAVAREDGSRVLWPSSPSAGWLSGVDRLWGTPNGQPLVALVGSQCHIWSCANERHGTYQAGVGQDWSTVMTDPWSQAHTFDPAMPLTYLPGPGAAAGAGAPTVFASEFGATSMSSFEAMSATLAPRSWSLHGGDVPADCTPTSLNKFMNNCTGPNAMAQRSWACDNLIWSYFGPALLSAGASEATFKGQLFLCAIASALSLKQNIEGRRASNQLGTLLWQLNEVRAWPQTQARFMCIPASHPSHLPVSYLLPPPNQSQIWSTGGWGSLEYSGAPWAPAGTLRGGRWKPTHYFLKTHLFADVMSACGYVGRSHTFVCYVTNARADAGFAGQLVLSTVDLASGAESPWAALPVAVAAGPGAMAWLSPTAPLPNATTTLLLARLEGAGGALIEEHLVHLTAPVNLLVPRATLASSVAASPNADGSANITVSSDAAALFVTLTSAAPGRFSDNAFLVLPSAPRLVVWLPFVAGDAEADLALLRSSLRVEDYSMYAA
jgi:hypothetical protein